MKREVVWSISWSSLTSHYNLVLCSFLSYTYLFFLRKSWGRKVCIMYFPMIVCTLVSFSILLSLFLHEIKALQFWSSPPHYALISNYYPWKRNWLFFWLIPENHSSLFSIHEIGKQKAKNSKKGGENRNINKSLPKSAMHSHLESFIELWLINV